MLQATVALLLLARAHSPSPPYTRFQYESPLPSIPAVMIDQYGTGVGLASETAKAHNLQARILWIDATANLERYNAEEKIANLTARIKRAGFNTVVLDIKPISGQTVYKSAFAPKLTEWRGQQLPASFDPLPTMVKQCHENGLSLFASMNAFSEGHRLFHVGPGYETPERQSVVYVPQPVIRAFTDSMDLAPIRDSFVHDQVSLISAISKIPREPGFAAVLSNHSNRLQVIGEGATNGPATTLKAGSGDLILFGSGLAGQFVRDHLLPGTTVKLDSRPTYLPTGQLTSGQYPLMMDLNDPAVQERALAMVHEVISNYGVDGIIYDDRLRYSGIDGDFSEISRSKFEQFLGRPIQWPDDVFKFTITPSLGRGIQPGKYFDSWMAWRATQIQTYLAKVRHEIRSARPTAQLGVYAGSWYGDYPALGHNYASPYANAGFWFSTPSYRATGTAPLMDFFIAGCYYSTATIYEAMGKDQGIGATVEAAASLCNRMIRDETWTYAGIELNDFKGNLDALGDALQAACASSQGVMVFDLSHDIESYWPEFDRAFAQRRIAPHQVAGELAALRKHRSIIDGYHQPERPVIIAAGSSGAGQ